MFECGDIVENKLGDRFLIQGSNGGAYRLLSYSDKFKSLYSINFDYSVEEVNKNFHKITDVKREYKTICNLLS